MDESSFHRIADAFLEALAERLEEGDPPWEAEYQPGSVAIELPGKRHFLVSKHTPSRQLWLSSPISGGLHFSYDAAAQRWVLSDGRELLALLEGEIAACIGAGA